MVATGMLRQITTHVYCVLFFTSRRHTQVKWQGLPGTLLCGASPEAQQPRTKAGGGWDPTPEPRP